MAIPIPIDQAKAILEDALAAAEHSFRSGDHLEAPPQEIIASTERLFTSSTQAYRDALIGCALARCYSAQIDIRLPSTEADDNSFSGRSLADSVVTPFLRQHAIPASTSPYLSSLRGGAKFIEGGAPRIQRDAAGFQALVDVVAYLGKSPQQHSVEYLRYLLRRFVQLRETSDLHLLSIAKPNLLQLNKLIDGLVSVKSGGKLSAMLATAMFQTLADCYQLAWEVEFQGINVADKASGAVGDITVKTEGRVILGVEVTERLVDKNRVVNTFQQKIAPVQLDDYLFITTIAPDPEALQAAHSYTAVGHEMNFVQVREWLINNLGTIGASCRAIFQSKMLALVAVQTADIKVAWNAKMSLAIGV